MVQAPTLKFYLENRNLKSNFQKLKKLMSPIKITNRNRLKIITDLEFQFINYLKIARINLKFQMQIQIQNLQK